MFNLLHINGNGKYISILDEPLYVAVGLSVSFRPEYMVGRILYAYKKRLYMVIACGMFKRQNVSLLWVL